MRSCRSQLACQLPVWRSGPVVNAPGLAGTAITHRGHIQRLHWILHIYSILPLLSDVSPLQETEQGRAGCVCSMPSIPPKVISLSSPLHNQTGTAGSLYLDNRAGQSYCIHWSCHGTWIISSLGVKLAEYLKCKGRIHFSLVIKSCMYVTSSLLEASPKPSPVWCHNCKWYSSLVSSRSVAGLQSGDQCDLIQSVIAQ